MKSVWFVLGVLLLSLVAGLLACAPVATPAAPAPTPTPAVAAPTPTAPAPVQPRFGGTLNFGADATLKAIDPVWTTAAVTDLYAIHLWEPLFAWDKGFNNAPVLLESWKASEDLKTWTFTIRDGIRFHDGALMTADDVVPSLNRWGERISKGVAMYRMVDAVTKVDDRTVTIALKKPFGLVPDTLVNNPYIMPKDIASVPADKGIDKYIGSGPFRLVEWKVGDRVVMEPFADYKARPEPASDRAGGRIAYVAKVISREIPDQATRVAAVEVGELDVAHRIAPDFYDRLSKNPKVKLVIHKPGSLTASVFNNVLPPTNNKKFRQAVLAATAPKDYMSAAFGPQDLWELCPAIFFCDSKWDTRVSEEKYWEADVEKGRRLLEEFKKETGWSGKVIVMAPSDYPFYYQEALVMERDLREKLKLDVDFQVMDWATLVTRRAKKEGWNVFHTGFSFGFSFDPFTAGWLGPTWFAYYDSPAIQKLQEDFATADDDDARKRIVDEVQRQVYEDAPVALRGAYNALSVVGERVRDYLVLDGFTAVWWHVWLAR